MNFFAKLFSNRRKKKGKPVPVETPKPNPVVRPVVNSISGTVNGTNIQTGSIHTMRTVTRKPRPEKGAYWDDDQHIYFGSVCQYPETPEERSMVTPSETFYGSGSPSGYDYPSSGVSSSYGGSGGSQSTSYSDTSSSPSSYSDSGSSGGGGGSD